MFEFWFNEVLRPSRVPPLISTSSDEKVVPLSRRFSLLEMDLPLAFPGMGSGELSPTGPQPGFPAEGALPQCPDPREVDFHRGDEG